MHGIWLTLFAIVTGFTVSGIAANLYRLCGITGDTANKRTLRMIVPYAAGGIADVLARLVGTRGL